MEAARAAARERQEAARKHKMEKQRADFKLKAHKMKLAAKKAMEKEAREAWKKDMLAVPQRFSAETLGNGPDGVKNRKAFLDRLKDLAPDLPYGLQLRWPALRTAYAEMYPNIFMKGKHVNLSKAIGPNFFDEVQRVIQDLGPHFKGVVTRRLGSVPVEPSGDASAFERYFHFMQSSLPWRSQMLEM